MSLEENDVTRFLAAGTHLGANNVNFQMEQYVYKRRQDGRCLLFSSYCFGRSHISYTVYNIILYSYSSCHLVFPPL